MNKIVLNAQNMQKANRLKVLNFIRENGMVRRPEISTQTGLSLSSVTNIVVHLIRNGLVTDNGVEDVSRVGRKADLLSFNYSAYRFICINIGLDRVSVSLTDLGLKIIAYDEREITGSDVESIIQHVSDMVSGEISADYEKVLAVGVSVSALIIKNKIFSSSHKWEAVDIKTRLEEKLVKPVFVYNNTMIRAVSCIDNGRKNQNLLFVDLDGGVGAVHISGGKVNRDIIGEVGHTTVCRDGEVCFCGNRGCLEAMCSVERIVSLSKSVIGDCTLSEAVDSAQSGNEKVRAILDGCLEYLGIGLANLVNVLNPAEIIINISEFLKFEYLYNKTIDSLKTRLLPQLRDDLVISKTGLSDEDIKRGLAKCLCDEVFSLKFELYNIEPDG